jgi:hypothetical protein
MSKQLPAVINDDEIHAVYSPSAAKRWMSCPESINACKGLPRQKSNFYSAEGTAAHTVAAINLGPYEKQIDGYPIFMFEGKQIPVTDEMLDAVKVYVDLVQEQAKKYDELPEIERKVKVAKDCFGTADSIIYSPYRILIVNDYKHGAGIQVDAEMNEQMMIYALGRLMEIPADEIKELPKVQMNIIQPRGAGESIKTFEIKTPDLWEWRNTVLLKAIGNARFEDASLNPGDWCKYCPAALTCPALKKENLAIAKLAFGDPIQHIDGKPTQWIDVLTPKAIADLLDKESMVMSFYKRLNEHAAELASKNTKIPGYSYEKKWGNRKWKNTEEVERLLWDKYENDIYEPAQLMSVAQLEKYLKHMKDDFDLKPYYEKPFTGYALKRANGKEITVKEVFEDVE